MDRKNVPSIFNDVIGPIMRGPSSSHCAASVRIGKMARDLMGGIIQEILIEYDTYGSLATTHESQGSDMGLYGGVLGWEASDEKLVNSAKVIQEMGIKVRIEIRDLNMKHPNTYKLTLKNDRETHEMVAISTGGGMIEIVEIDQVKVSMIGDTYETLLFTNDPHMLKYLQEALLPHEVVHNDGPGTSITEIKTPHPLDTNTLNEIKTKFKIRDVKELKPVLPILTPKEITVPFLTCKEMLQYNEGKNLSLWELAVQYESARGNIPAEEVFTKMQEIVQIMQKAILEGLEGTEYEDRILGYQSGFFQTQMEKKQLHEAGILNCMILYITAIMEIKSSMGVIVAAPTAGAAGALPGP